MLLELLTSRTESDYETARVAGLTEFRSHFSGDSWSCFVERTPYTADNYNNLWNNELRSGVKNRLTASGLGTAEYGAWLGENHFIRAIAYSNLLFGDSYKDNQGWRILALGIPAARVVAVGIASHYQQAQNHNHLGRASNVFFDHIQSTLADDPPMIGRKVTPEDWDRAGLMNLPVTVLAGVDVSDVSAENPGLWLKDLRTTTLKKILASFILVDSITPGPGFDAAISESLDGLERIGARLLGPA